MKNLIPVLMVFALAATGAHAQSQSGANPYDVPMFAGQVGKTYASAQSDCVQCGIIADSESASFDYEGSTLPRFPFQARSESSYTIVTVESFCNGGCTIQYGWNENDSEGSIAN